jgi:hypothetical protein
VQLVTLVYEPDADVFGEKLSVLTLAPRPS